MPKAAADIHKRIAQLDRAHVGVSIASLKNQIEHVFEDLFPHTLHLPKKHWSGVYFCGMGGSALGADFIRSVYAPWLQVPVTIVNDYHLPRAISRDAIIVVCSYSGSTEEAISCLREARKRKLSSVVITSGGALARLAKKFGTPAYVFDPAHNPSNQPRIGTGYTMTCFYTVLRKTNLLTGNFEHLSKAVAHMRIDPAAALRLARATLGKSFIIVASGFLQGNAHVVSNQLNETSKVFAPYFILPELNHHLLEGLGSLRRQRGLWTVLFLESSHYDPVIQQRFTVTKKVIYKQGFSHHSIRFPGTRVQQALKMLSFGGWLSYYQGILLGHNPSQIPWVDYFKQQMKS